jgi:hypothetical protein
MRFKMAFERKNGKLIKMGRLFRVNNIKIKIELIIPDSPNTPPFASRSNQNEASIKIVNEIKGK